MIEDEITRAGEWWRKVRTDGRILFAEVVQTGEVGDAPLIPGIDPSRAEVRYHNDEIRSDAVYSARFTDPPRARAVLTARGYVRVT